MLAIDAPLARAAETVPFMTTHRAVRFVVFDAKVRGAGNGLAVAGRRSWVDAWLKPVLEVLAGVPSVVFGFFALRVLGPDLVKPVFGTAQNTSLLVTGVAIGLLVTPLMASISEDSLRAVPSALREASTGLGARRSTTVVKVV